MKQIFTAILVLSFSITVYAASFDCKKAISKDEKTICADRVLSEKDVEMATTYRLLSGLFAMGVRDDMKDAQQLWLSERKKCGSNKVCLRNTYEARLKALNQLYEGINKPI